MLRQGQPTTPRRGMQARNRHRGDEGAPDGDAAGNFDLIGVTPAATVDASGLDPGPVLLMVRNAVARIDEGAVLEVTGGDDGLGDELSGWCRLNGCDVVASLDAGADRTWLLRKGPAAAAWERPTGESPCPAGTGGGSTCGTGSRAGRGRSRRRPPRTTASCRAGPWPSRACRPTPSR